MCEDDRGVLRRSVLKSGAVAASVLSLGHISSNPASSAVLEADALLARWPLRDGFDDVVGSHDARSAVGSGGFGTYHGREALDFDGSLGVRASRGGSRALNLVGPGDGPHTVAMWVYFDEPTGGQPFGGTGTADHSLYKNDTGLRIVANTTSDADTVELRASISPYGNPDAEGYGMPDDATVMLPVGTWTHVTCVVDATNYLRLYVDGTEQFGDTSMDGHNGYQREFWSDITVGSWYGGNPEEWADLLDGKLADLRIYETALSEQQVQRLISNTTGEPQQSTGSAEVTASFATGTVGPGSRVPMDLTVTNTDNSAADVTVTFGDAETPEGISIPGERFTVVEHDDAGGDWIGDGWVWESLGAGETAEASVTFAIADGVPGGDYGITVTADPEANASASLTVDPNDLQREITVRSVDFDRTPHRTTTQTLGFTQVSYDETATLFGGPMGSSLLVEVEADRDSETLLHRAKGTARDESGAVVDEWTVDLAGRIMQGTYTYRLPIGADLDPGTYSLSVTMQHDEANFGRDWVDVGSGATEITVEEYDDTPILSVPSQDYDGDGQQEQALGNRYHVSLAEQSPEVEFVMQTIRLLTTMYTGEGVPQFGVDQGTVNELAANTAQARARSTDGTVTLYWSNKPQRASSGTNPLAVRYDRAVLTARVPDSVDVVDDGGADYFQRDAENEEYVLTWIRTEVDKGIEPQVVEYGFDHDDPTGTEQFRVEAPSEQTVTVEYSLSLELGPFAGKPTEQAAYKVPVESPATEIPSRYDYEGWQENPEDVHWMSVGLTKRDADVTVPTEASDSSGDTGSENGSSLVDQFNEFLDDFL